MSGEAISDPVERFVSAVRTSEGPTGAQLQEVLDVLRKWLARRDLTPEDREEVSSDAVGRLMAIIERGELDLGRPPGAWLRVVADHLAIDAQRRRIRRPAELLHEDALIDEREEDRVARFLDSTSTAEDVRTALRKAADAGDHQVVKTVTAWLALVHQDGESPGTRDVADRMGVSHMTVQRALRKFGDWLSD